MQWEIVIKFEIKIEKSKLTREPANMCSFVDGKRQNMSRLGGFVDAQKQDICLRYLTQTKQ